MNVHLRRQLLGERIHCCFRVLEKQLEVGSGWALMLWFGIVNQSDGL